MTAERRATVPVAAVLAVIFLTSPVSAADTQSYAVEIAGTGNAQVDATINASSQLVTLRKAGPLPPFALATRAREDIPRLQTVLDSFGYYSNQVTVTIDGLSPDDPQLPARMDAVPTNRTVTVKVTPTPGPLYRIGKVTLDGAVPERDRSALALKSGDPVIAAAVLDGRERLLSALQEDGYALATVDEPDATADDQAHTIDVTYKVRTGARATIGAIRFKGLKDVNESFARRALQIHTGDRYQPSRIEERATGAGGVGGFFWRKRACRGAACPRRQYSVAVRRAGTAAPCGDLGGHLFHRSWHHLVHHLVAPQPVWQCRAVELDGGRNGPGQLPAPAWVTICWRSISSPISWSKTRSWSLISAASSSSLTPMIRPRKRSPPLYGANFRPYGPAAPACR